MVFARLPIGLKIPESISHVFTRLRVVFAWLPIGLKIPERYFICFHVATRGIYMASNRSEGSWEVFHVFSRGYALYLHGFQ